MTLDVRVYPTICDTTVRVTALGNPARGLRFRLEGGHEDLDRDDLEDLAGKIQMLLESMGWGGDYSSWQYPADGPLPILGYEYERGDGGRLIVFIEGSWAYLTDPQLEDLRDLIGRVLDEDAFDPDDLLHRVPPDQ